MQLTKTERYITGRVQNFLEESVKCNDSHDRAWYNRMAQELEWVKEIHTGNHSKACVLEEYGQMRLL